MKDLFGEEYGIDQHLGFSLQFSALERDQLATSDAEISPSVKNCIAAFYDGLSADELSSDRFAFRMLFVPKLVGKPGQADEVIEFLKADDEITKTVNRDLLAFKEVERPKSLPSQVVATMRKEGHEGFTMHRHTLLWHELDAKGSAKGYGVEVAGQWYWYDSWVDQVRQRCEAENE